MIRSLIHDQTYEVFSWEDFGQGVETLAGKIIDKKESFDRVIALAKGGTTIARPILDLLGMKELSSIQIEFYSGIATTNRTPVITQSLPISIRGEKVLIIDDIADSGETLAMARSYLGFHGASEVQTATLVIKPWTKVIPDFYSHTSKAWIIWPWETRETTTLLSDIWGKKGDTKIQIVENLAKLGYKSVIPV